MNLTRMTLQTPVPLARPLVPVSPRARKKRGSRSFTWRSSPMADPGNYQVQRSSLEVREGHGEVISSHIVTNNIGKHTSIAASWPLKCIL